MVNCDQYEFKMSLSDISPKSSPVYGSFNYLGFIFTVSFFCHRKKYFSLLHYSIFF